MLAYLLDTNYEALGSFLYSKRKLYRSFEIPKKSGGMREITTPIKPLKEIQRKLKPLIEPYTSHREAAHGFIEGKSIVSNASRHVRKNFVFNLDLLDFFGSINFGRVKRLFESAPFNLPAKVATVVAQIVCFDNQLPQGAPTSPLISNLIAFKLDGNLTALARRAGVNYSRYADDLTFSSNSLNLLKNHGILTIDESAQVKVGKDLKNIIKANGFDINVNKTRLQGRGQHQGVTGITVNRKVNVTRSFVRKTASILYSICKWGSANAEREHLKKYRTKSLSPRARQRTFLNEGDLILKIVKGRVNYIRMVKGEASPVYRRLAYRLTVALGCPNEDYNKDWETLLAESVYVLHNYYDSTQGSCVLIENLGFVTNKHVLKCVTTSNFEGHVVITGPFDYAKDLPLISFLGASDTNDVALICPSVHQHSQPSLKIASSPDYRKGTKVVAIGFPNHTEGTPPEILYCTIQGKTKFQKNDRYLLSCNIHHGFSGGAVLNLDGDVIGIVSNGNEVGARKSVGNMFIPIQDVAEALSHISK
ncbi:reverse transcriptase domain-containing protein [Idiomarina fontislapidosi]|nr:reverse transcriptase domain-containing protein [Idiomarina fontislapidosi]